jgi:ribulose-5-phosphate 4-epimerase/fuculose-1-phosphate aldolase
LPRLTPAAELALLARMLHREGYDDHLAGHITYRQGDGTFLVNPFGLTWRQLRASDVMRMDAAGQTLEGPWTISPAITLHVELHRVRDVTVAIHNHPRWGTLWADLGRAPEIHDQTGAMYHGGVAVCHEYGGPVNYPENARQVVAAMGDANVSLLAHHGVLIAAGDVEQAYLRAMSFEWRCRQAYRVGCAGGATPMDPDVAARHGERYNHRSFTGLFAAMARDVLRDDPDVLE